MIGWCSALKNLHKVLEILSVVEHTREMESLQSSPDNITHELGELGWVILLLSVPIEVNTWPAGERDQVWCVGAMRHVEISEFGLPHKLALAGAEARQFFNN